MSQMKIKPNFWRGACSALVLCTAPVMAQIGIWTSAAELDSIPTFGPAWQEVLRGANQDCANPNLSNQNDNTNVYVLAAGIVYARTGNALYQAKVITACEKLLQQGRPDSTSLAWARETGAYVMAADLVGYRTAAFEEWLRQMAEIYVAVDKRTLRNVFAGRPNNWGSHAFASLCAIYRFLQDTTALVAMRDYWIRGITGPNPGFEYGTDLSWHADETNPRIINPKGATKEGVNIDGIVPDDMRRGSSFRDPPKRTQYPWEFLQGQVTAARILERAGMPIWNSGDSAIYRVAYHLQIRLHNAYGRWAAEGDDEWVLPFLDKAYGTNWSSSQPRLWRHGKNAGWGYVTLARSRREFEKPSAPETGQTPAVPGAYKLYQNQPNPFNPATAIYFSLPQAEHVRLAIYDYTGQLVTLLRDESLSAGTYAQIWNTESANGRRVASGVYFCYLRAGAHVEKIKMMVLR